MTTREREVHKFVHFGRPAAREALRDGPTGADRARDVVSLRRQAPTKKERPAYGLSRKERRLKFALDGTTPGGRPQPSPAEIAEMRAELRATT